MYYEQIKNIRVAWAENPSTTFLYVGEGRSEEVKMISCSVMWGNYITSSEEYFSGALNNLKIVDK